MFRWMLLWLLATGSAGASVFSVDSCVHREGDDPTWAALGMAASDGWDSRHWYDVRFRTLAWLRCRVEIPELYRAGQKPMGLYVSGTLSTEIWWNGELLGRNGQPAGNAKSETAGDINVVFFVPPERLLPGDQTLAIRLSAHHAGYRINTPLDALYIAPYQNPLSVIRNQYRPSMFTVGALLLAAAFLAGMWLRTRTAASAWLALACVFVLGQLGAEVSRAFWSYAYSWHATRLLAVSLFSLAGGFCLVGYLTARFAGSRRWLIPIVLVGVISIPILRVPDLITILIIATSLVCGLGVAFVTLRRGQRDAWIALIALLGALIVLAHEPTQFLDQGQFLTFTLLLLVFFVDHIRSFDRTSRERDQAQLTSARLELELLKKHLRPHFLMNTLTSLSEWVETAPRTGVAMIDALAKEFHTLNRVADKTLIPIEDELDLCRTHLRIMGFRQDLEFSLEVEGDPVDGLMIPPAVLHTLVENALTYGAYQQDTTLTLTVERGPRRALLTLRVPSKATDAGPEGTGLAYVRARLAEAFGERWVFDGGPDNRGSWVSRLEFPGVAQ
ncbi:MAG: sensor histidine kinase [Pseudomonadota bacterium]